MEGFVLYQQDTSWETPGRSRKIWDINIKIDLMERGLVLYKHC
jgi:hypothetical protein